MDESIKKTNINRERYKAKENLPDNVVTKQCL